MKRRKGLVSKVIAMTMAAALTFTSGFGGLGMSAKAAFDGMTAETTVTKDRQEALAVTKTQNADTFSWDNATVYFLLTDRFVNGRTDNDHSYNRGCDENGNVVSGMDERATFHGGDFKGLTQKIEEGYFDDLGINAIWLSAPYEQIHGYLTGGSTTPTFAHYAYHGYYVLDYTQTDANFGTEAEFQTLVDTAHRHGIRVIMDIVLNHAGYNSMYDMNEYGFGGLAEDWKDVYYGNMTNVLEKAYHSHIIYNSESGNDSALAAKWANWWGPDWIRAGLEGYSQGSGNDDTTTPVAGLPDFKTESTATVGIPNLLKTKWTKEGTLSAKTSEVQNWLSSNGYSQTVNNYVCYWLSSWVRKYGVDGFRCDTAKHVKPSEWAVLHNMCTQALKEWKAANPTKKLDDLDFWMTGEFWDYNIGYGKTKYFTEGKFDSMINFGTCGGGALASGTVGGLYSGYAQAINSDPEFNQLSFISSHDEVLAKSSQNMYDMGSAFVLLPGGIQIYYGDESGRDLVSGVNFDGAGGSGQSLRSDMNWDSMDEELLAHWQKVCTFRKNHIAVGAGSNTELESTSGTAFGRTYSKGNITDRIAGVVYASANSDVTIDVSSLWANGETVINYYDGSACQVSGGKVTFNAGPHGTILIADKGDKPIVSVNGNAKFKGTQQVTVSVEQADYAILSIDGGHSVKVTNGTKLTIGSTAYEGDNVVISYTATNTKGTVNGKKTFYKAYADEDISGGGGGVVVTTPAKIHVKMADGSAPKVYGWTGSSSNFTAAWPGDTFSTKDSEGYYVGEYSSVTGSYNLVIHNGGSVKTADITGLKGEVWIDVSASSGYDVKGDTVVVEDESDIIIHVSALPNGSAPYLYVWDAANKACNGGFPGKQLTEKDSDGNYVLTFKAKPAVNCIVSGGSNQNQSGNLTGITAEAWIKINSNDCSDVKMTKQDAVESKFTKMKQLARKSLIYTSSDYTSTTWTAFKNKAASAKTLIDQGEKDADPTAVNNMYDQLVSAEGALVLATPKISASTSGTKVISGTAVKGAKVTVVYSGKTYTADANELTGKWSVTTSTSLSGTFTVKAEWNGKTSAVGTKTVGVVDDGGDEPDPTPVESPIPTLTAGNEQIKATWDAVDGATNYRVFTYLNKQYTRIGDTTSTAYTVTGLENGTKYGIYVLAYVNNSWLQSDSSHIRYATPTAGSTQVVYKPVITLTAGSKQIKATWTKISGVTKYRVFTYLNKKYTKIGDTTSTSYTVTGLTNGTKYGIYVIAYANGKWQESDTSHIKYATPVASTTTSYKPTPTLTAGDKQIKVVWTALSGATKYRVFTYVNGTYTKVAETENHGVVVKNLKNGTKYGIYVIAYANGKWQESDTSYIRYATPTAGTSTTDYKPVISLTPGSKQITVTWAFITGATKYRVYTYINDDYTLITETTNRGYVIKNLSSSINYGVYVIAYVNGKWVASDKTHIKYATPNA